jgi:GntR family transcriptional repressor for pyruvate dehydrogenase complex
MEISPIKSRTLVEEVCERLVAFVRESGGEGERLPSERKLAEQFQVARGVVREAIKRLEIQGLLEVRQGSGVRAVYRPHEALNASLGMLLPEMEERLRQLADARITIEPAVAEMAAKKAKRKDVAMLWEIQDALEAAEDLSSAVEIDIKFHRTLAEIAGNEVFKLVLQSTGDLRRESSQRSIGVAGKAKAARQHRAVISAIEAKDAAAARDGMRIHMAEAKRDLAKPNRKKK